jgi:hypothetical protein
MQQPINSLRLKQTSDVWEEYGSSARSFSLSKIGCKLEEVLHPTGRGRAEQSAAGDRLQRPLLRRSRFQPRLSRSVDMTSDVKGWEQLFYVRLIVFPCVDRKSRSQ